MGFFFWWLGFDPTAPKAPTHSAKGADYSAKGADYSAKGADYSAKGAEYESQGQARSASPLVHKRNAPALKGA
jgi:hypothetical protein